MYRMPWKVFAGKIIDIEDKEEDNSVNEDEEPKRRGDIKRQKKKKASNNKKHKKRRLIRKMRNIKRIIWRKKLQKLVKKEGRTK